MLNNREKDKFEKMAKLQKIYHKMIKNKAKEEDLIQTVQNYILSLNDLKEIPTKKVRTVSLSVNDYEQISSTIQQILSSGIISKINLGLCQILFEFLTIFGNDSVQINIYNMFKPLIFRSLELFIELKPSNFKPFNALWMQNPLETFGKDVFTTILWYPTTNFEYILKDFTNTFFNQLTNKYIDIWLMWFIKTLTELERKPLPDNFIYNTVYMMISFLSGPIQSYKVPLYPIRNIWVTQTKPETKESLANIFQEKSETTHNSFYFLFYLFYLLDNQMFTRDNIDKAISSACDQTLAARFIVHLACKSYFFVASVDPKSLIAYSKSHAVTQSKAISENVLQFLSSCEDLINKPWLYSQQNISLPSLEYAQNREFASLGLDIENSGSNLVTDDIILSICNEKRPLYCALFIETILSISKVCPQTIHAVPRTKICSLFLPALLNSHKEDKLITNSVLLHLLSDCTIQKVLPTKVYALWIEKIISICFSDSKEEFNLTLKCLSQTINYCMPGSNLLVPLFFYVLQKIKKFSSIIESENISIMANAFSSAHVIRYPESNKKLFDLMKKKKVTIPKDFQTFDISSVFSDISILYEIADKNQKPNVFAAAINAAYEDIIHSFDITPFMNFFATNITNISKDEMESLLVFSDIDSISGTVIKTITQHLIKASSYDSLKTAVNLIILSNNVDFTDILPLLSDALKEDKFKGLRDYFVNEYKRYPYVHGINYPESHLSLFDGSQAPPFIISDNKQTIAACNRDNETKVLFASKNKFGCTSFISSISKADPLTRDITCDPQNITQPVTDLEKQWGEYSKLEPIPLQCDYQHKQDQNKTNPKQSNLQHESSKYILPISDSVVQLGIISPHENNYKLIPSDASSVRTEKALYALHSRYVHKIAILYIGQNHRDQDQILALKADDASQNFYNFVGQVGWTVDLTTHQSFTGGLDTTNFSTGKTSVYWANAIDEVMWHISTMIETQANDKQCIYKKRHIGNDMVHVIYSEDSFEYDPTTITSQFNHAHIIIYPLSNRRYCVQVHQKPAVKWFGTLRGVSVVSEEALPMLVRFSAIFADNSSRVSTSGSKIVPEELISSTVQNLYKSHSDEDPYLYALSLD